MTTDQTNTEPTEEEGADAELRRQVRIQLEESEKHAAAKKEKRLSSMTDAEFRDYVRGKFSYDPY